MRKIVFALPFVLAACSGTYTNSKLGAELSPSVNVAPIDAKINVGGKISGTAHCKDLFFIPISSPDHQTYEPTTLGKLGNPAGTSCIAGALYDAMSKSGADVIISPQYTTVDKKFACVPQVGCLYRDAQVIVSGYVGKISYIK